MRSSQLIPAMDGWHDGEEEDILVLMVLLSLRYNDAVYPLQYIFYIVTIYDYFGHPNDKLHRHSNVFSSLSRQLMVH